MRFSIIEVLHDIAFLYRDLVWEFRYRRVIIAWFAVLAFTVVLIQINTIGGAPVSESDQIVTLIRQLGIPGAATVVALLMFWRLSIRFGQWAKPFVENFISAHISLINSLKETQSQLVAYQLKHQEMQNKHQDTLVIMAANNKSAHDATQDCLIAGAEACKSLAKDMPHGQEIIQHLSDIKEIVKDNQSQDNRKNR